MSVSIDFLRLTLAAVCTLKTISHDELAIQSMLLTRAA
jgi:hypothetical protein